MSCKILNQHKEVIDLNKRLLQGLCNKFK
uniref:Uncharacterized protein n=1 Tax=Rhizophora mucronata TaxID=61149 RepID=A0A2P2NXT9_RHIMU